MATSNESTSPVLDLILTRPTITIEGTVYELRNQNELSLFEFRRLKRLGERIDELEQLDDPDPSVEQEYREKLRAVVQVVLVAPDDVHAKLQTGQLTLVMTAFFSLSLTRLQQTRATSEAAPGRVVPSPTKRARPASRASMAAPQVTG